MLLLGLLALLGYMAHAVQLNISDNNEWCRHVSDLVFQLIKGSLLLRLRWSAVPAAVMSIGTADIFARHFSLAHIDPQISAPAEAKVAKIESLVLQIRAIFAVIFLPIQFALYVQLLGGMWIIQILPALVFGLYRLGLEPGVLPGSAGGHLVGNIFRLLDGINRCTQLISGPLKLTFLYGLVGARREYCRCGRRSNDLPVARW